MVTLAAAAFVAIFFFGVPFPLIILVAAAIGYAGPARARPRFRPAATAAARRRPRMKACSAVTCHRMRG